MKTSRKLMALNPSDRGTLENIMRDPWMRMGKEKKLRSYTECFMTIRTPRVPKVMMNMGYGWDQIQGL